jgi:hypothetical protein
MTSTTNEVSRELLRGARWYTVWLTGAQLVVITVAAVVNGAINDPVTISVWQWPALMWVRYPLIALGLAMTSGWLPVFLANGLIRRQFARGGLVFGGGIIVILAAMSLLGFVLERVVYAIGGFDVALDEEEIAVMGVVYVVLLGCYLATGLLIGGAVTRWSSRQAPWMITLFVIPMIAGEIVLGTFWGGVEQGNLRNVIPLALGVPLMCGVVAVAAYVWFLIVRDVAIQPKKA